MKNPKRHCCYCKKAYRPDSRCVRYRQKACSRKSCRRARQRQNYRHWIKLHPSHAADRRHKIRAWAKAYPNYWRQYRAAHPAYVQKDNARRAVSLRKARCSAKQSTIRQIAVDKLRGIQALTPSVCSAKQITIDRRVDGLLDYLFWTVTEACSAKPKTIVPGIAISPS